MIGRRLLLAGAAGLAATPAAWAQAPALNVVELRQYTLRGGARGRFAAMFGREFVATQDEVGCHVRGVFRDLDDPDRFVWLRGFTDMAARKAALEAFYFGPAWKAHRDEANASIADSDNVLLLRPVSGEAGPRTLQGPGVVRIAIHHLRGVDAAAFAAFFAARLQPLIAAAGGRVIATLTTEAAPNNFPRLPVRERDPVFLWIGRFPDLAAERRFDVRLAAASGWRDGVADALLPALMQKPEVLRLETLIPVPDV